MEHRINVAVPKQLHDALKALSDKDGRGVPELTRTALVEYVERRKQ
jgi:hypothetical protein